jgi:tRNA/tmRNA/rRNA uracil-C5-methylase (TrmA/RlmC/RlmD family)
MEREPATAPRPPVGWRGEVEIEDVAFGGNGVARVDGFVVFVPFVAAGERVEIELTEVRKQFARARLRRVLTPSPQRVKPECPHFGACGGCQYQHLDYAEQLRVKHRQISDLMQRLAKLDPDRIRPVVPCPRPYGYRNRIMLRSQWNGREQRLIVGFIRYDNHWVEELDECRIAEPELSARIREVRANPPPKGGLKVVLRKYPEGWELPRDSFFQNNFHLLPGLVAAVRECLVNAGTRQLLDLYCGVGFFALELADQVERFVGVELDQKAVEAARVNAARRGATNGEFLRARAEEALPELLTRVPAGETTVLVDPPRKGCARSMIEQWLEVRPAQIIYVSCQPATLARDLKRLTADGVYRLEQLTPLDMFPQTQHLECVADLRLADTPEDAA